MCQMQRKATQMGSNSKPAAIWVAQINIQSKACSIPRSLVPNKMAHAAQAAACCVNSANASER